MVVDWLSKMGKKGFEAFVKTSMKDVFDERFETNFEAKVEPRLRNIETRLTGLESGQKAIDSRLTGIEQRLDLADDVAQLKAKVAMLEAHRG